MDGLTKKEREVVEKLRRLREDYEAKQKAILDKFIAKVEGTDYWKRAYRAMLETESWPGWKKKACLSQPDRLDDSL